MTEKCRAFYLESKLAQERLLRVKPDAIFKKVLLILVITGAFSSLYVRLLGPPAVILTGISFCLLIMMWLGLELIGRRAPAKVTKILQSTIVVLVLAAVISLLTLVFTARAGVCVINKQPIYALREHYLLNSHGKKTEVSRNQYLAVGTSFAVGFHAMMLVVLLVILTDRKKSRQELA